VVVGVRPGGARLRHSLGDRATKVHEIDVMDFDQVANSIFDVSPDAVFHLAGFTSVGASWQSPAQAIAVNAIGTLNSLESVRKFTKSTGQQCRVVHASSGEIFAGLGAGLRDEASSIAPVSPYGVGKAAAIESLRHYRSHFGVDARAAILFSHESPLRGGDFVSRRISDQVAAICLGIGSTVRLGNLSARRDWGFAGDYARAMVNIAEHNEADDFIVATGESHSVQEWVEVALRFAGIEDWQERVTSDNQLLRPDDPPILVGDATKARNVLGWHPTVPFESLVELMLNDSIQRLRRAQDK